MGTILRKYASILLAAAVLSPLFCTGCAARVRVYDPYYHDYHTWASENGYYVQWEHDTHRHHEDFNKRNKDEQKEYWDWRHKQH